MMPYRASALERPGDDEERRARDRLAPVLRSDERVLWAQRPKQGIRFAKRDGIGSVIGVFWTAFAVFITYCLSMETWWMGAIFGTPFIVIGLNLVFVRYLVDAWRRSRTAYAVTNRRVIVVDRKAKVFELAALPDIVTQEHEDGAVDMWLGPREDREGDELPPTLAAVPRGRAFYRELMEARASVLSSEELRSRSQDVETTSTLEEEGESDQDAGLPRSMSS